MVETTRRSFLKAAGLGIAGAAVPASQRTAAAAKPVDDVDARNGVALALAPICGDGFGDENVEYAFDLRPELGYRNVEFNVWYPRNITPSGIHSIQERCFENGLKPVSLQGSSFGGHAVKDVAHKLWHMEQAKYLGCRRVKFTGAGRGTEGGLERVVEVLQELAPAADEMDVLIAVENHANNVIENIEDYERIFEAVPSGHVGMCLDMGHFDGANVDNFEVIRRFHERVVHIDLKDTRERGVHDVVNFGSGVTDVHGIVQKILEHGYTGYIVVEQAKSNPDRTTLAANLARARELFEQYER